MGSEDSQAFHNNAPASIRCSQTISLHSQECFCTPTASRQYHLTNSSLYVIQKHNSEHHAMQPTPSNSIPSSHKSIIVKPIFGIDLYKKGTFCPLQSVPCHAMPYHDADADANATPCASTSKSSPFIDLFFFAPQCCRYFQETRRSFPVASLPLRSLPDLLPPKFC